MLDDTEGDLRRTECHFDRVFISDIRTDDRRSLLVRVGNPRRPHGDTVKAKRACVDLDTAGQVIGIQVSWDEQT